MDFGEILDAWDDQRGRLKRKKKQDHLMERLLENYLPEQEDFKAKSGAPEREEKHKQRQSLRKIKPQRVLDLHGYTLQEALHVLEKFLENCRKQNIRKILIIHGKGNHSQAGPVLPKGILRFIQASPLAGEYGFADRTQGGRGALWVILRY